MPAWQIYACIPEEWINGLATDDDDDDDESTPLCCLAAGSHHNPCTEGIKVFQHPQPDTS